MKATGIVRKLDTLGRVVLPKELRDLFDIKHNDSLEIFVDQENIVLRKYQPSCIFCNSLDNIEVYKDKKVCAECIKNLKNL